MKSKKKARNGLKRIQGLYNMGAEVNRPPTVGCPLKRSNSASNIHLRLLLDGNSTSAASSANEPFLKKIPKGKEEDVNNNFINNATTPRVQFQAYAAIISAENESGKSGESGNRNSGSSPQPLGQHHYHHHKYHHKHRRSTNDPNQEGVDRDKRKRRSKVQEGSVDAEERRRSRRQSEKRRSKDEGEGGAKKDSRKSKDHSRRKSTRESDDDIERQKKRPARRSEEEEVQEGRRSHCKSEEREKDRKLESKRKSRVGEETVQEGSGGRRSKARSSKDTAEDVEEGDHHHRHRHRRRDSRRHRELPKEESTLPEEEEPAQRVKSQKHHDSTKDKPRDETTTEERVNKTHEHHHGFNKDETAEENFLIKRYIEESKTSKKVQEAEPLSELDPSIINVNRKSTRNSKSRPVSYLASTKLKSKPPKSPYPLRKETRGSQSSKKSKKKVSKKIGKPAKVQTIEPVEVHTPRAPNNNPPHNKDKKKKEEMSKPDMNYNLSPKSGDVDDREEGGRTRLPSYVFEPLDENSTKVKNYHAFQLTGVEPDDNGSGKGDASGQDNVAKPPQSSSSGSPPASSVQTAPAVEVVEVADGEIKTEKAAVTSRKLSSLDHSTDSSDVTPPKKAEEVTGSGDQGFIDLQPMAVAEMSIAASSVAESVSGSREDASEVEEVTSQEARSSVSPGSISKAPGKKSRVKKQNTSEAQYSQRSGSGYKKSEEYDKYGQSGSNKSGTGTENGGSEKPSLMMTDKGAIRFQLPGRIQHKTTIKLAHYPENSNDTVVVNVPTTDEANSSDNCGGELGANVQDQSPCDPYGYYGAGQQQNYYMQQAQQQYNMQMQGQPMQGQPMQGQPMDGMNNYGSVGYMNYPYNCYNPYNPYSYGCGGYPPC